MRIHYLVAVGVASLVWGGEKKIEPGFASSDEAEITASLLLEKAEVDQALGADLPKGVVAVKVRLRPKGEKPLKITRDDFVLLNSNDGQRSTPFAPTQLAGNGGLTLQSRKMDGWAAMGNGPVWGGVGGMPGRGPSSGGGIGNRTAQVEGVDVKPKEGDGAEEKPGAKPKVDPLLAILKSKELPEKATTDVVEGLLYFPLDGKVKLKNMSLFFKAPGGKLEVRFQR